VSGKELEKQIDEYLARVSISEKFKDWAIKYLHEWQKLESTTRNDIIQAQQKAYQDCVRRIDNLVKLKTSPGNNDHSLLSDEEYGRQRVELLKEKSALEELLRDAGHRVERWVNLSEQVFEFACTARARFAKGDAKTKKEILAAIGSNLTLKDKKLCIEARKPFFILEKSMPADKPRNGSIEPENTGLLYEQKRARAFHRPKGLGDVDDVRTYGRRFKKLVKEIYTFFQRRSLCPCEECQKELFCVSSLTEWRIRQRWNSLPIPARKCLLSASKGGQQGPLNKLRKHQ